MRPAPSGKHAVPADEGDSDSVVGDASPAKKPRDRSPSAASSSSASSSVASSGSKGVVGDDNTAAVADAKWPTHLCGQALSIVRGRSDETWHYHGRLSVRCSNAAHVGCTKSRSIELCTAELGPQAPLLFLGAWLAKSHDMPVAAHKAFKPTMADMKAFAGGCR